VVGWNREAIGLKHLAVFILADRAIVELGEGLERASSDREITSRWKCEAGRRLMRAIASAGDALITK